MKISLNFIFQFVTTNRSTIVIDIAKLDRTKSATVDRLFNAICENSSFELSVLGNISSFVVVALLIFTLGFIGNIVTVVVISCWRKLHTPTFTMIVCLAVSDAYSLLAEILFSYTNLIVLLMVCLKQPSSWTLFVINVIGYIGTYNSGVQLCLLVGLRFTAIVYPFKYKTYCTCKAVIVVCVVASIISLVFCFLGNILIKMFDVNVCAVSTFVFVLNFFLPCTVFILLHCLKLRALRRSPTLNRNSSLKMNIVLLILMSVYATFSASMLLSVILKCFSNQNEVLYPFLISRMAFLLNCAVNPYIYFFSSPPVVQLFRKMWHRLRNRCQVTDNGNAEEIEMNNIPTAYS